MTPDQPSLPNVAVVMIHGGAANEYEFLYTPDGPAQYLDLTKTNPSQSRVGIAQHMASLGVAVLAVSLPGPLLQKIPYDPLRDFSPVALLVREVNIVAVHPSLPANSVKELIALAKAKPGELNYAATSIGGPPHLAGELFKSMAGVSIVRVAYKGSAQAITALMSGEVQLVITDVGLIAPHMKSGRLRGLAVSSAEPTALAPGLPTVAASGIPGYELVSLTGLWAPGKTPAALINRVNQEVVRAINQPEFKERFLTVGQEVITSSPEQFATIVKTDIARTRKVIKDAGIKLD